jgi:AmmeMemoRadiSam system protein B
MNATRQPAVAGAFYPADPARLAVAVQDCLREATAPAPASGESPPKAIIAPHAGYLYSGPVAGSAYRRVAPLRGAISRVVLAGPAHRVPVRGVAVPHAGAFATPLGTVTLDEEAVERLRRLPFVETSDHAHALEHSLEVHLPFLQAVLGHFRLVPVVVGGASPGEVAELLEEVWGGAETLIVVSSDLSHFLPYAAACRRDRATADGILALDARIEPEEACGAAPVNGLLEVARRRHLVPELVDLRNSGDTAGGRDRVVGYASFVFREPEGGHD